MRIQRVPDRAASTGHNAALSFIPSARKIEMRIDTMAKSSRQKDRKPAVVCCMGFALSSIPSAT